MCGVANVLKLVHLGIITMIYNWNAQNVHQNA